MSDNKEFFDKVNEQLQKGKTSPLHYSESTSPNVQLLSEQDIFSLAKELAKGYTQQQITDFLKETGREVTIMSVNRMLKGERRFLQLAMDWVIARYPADVDWEGGKDAVRYFKLVED